MNNKNVNINWNWTGLLGVAFIILKLCKVISWSWVWVLSPFWIPIILAIVIIAIFAIINR